MAARRCGQHAGGIMHRSLGGALILLVGLIGQATALTLISKPPDFRDGRESDFDPKPSGYFAEFASSFMISCDATATQATWYGLYAWDGYLVPAVDDFVV